MITTVWGATDKPVSSRRLVETLTPANSLEGTLYIGYPIIGTPEGSFPIDALLVSPVLGLILFSVIEGKDLSNFASIQDEAYNKMQAKLLQHQSLIQRRQLRVEVHTLTFAPAIPNFVADDDHLVCNSNNLVATLSELKPSDSTAYPALVSVIQAISGLRRGRKRRELTSPTSKGTKLKSLEDSIANLDSQQSAAVVETFDGVQRIRGLAGCGKTIVLALKVAYLHAKHRDWLIGVTFNTRSLKKQFETLITSFVLEQSNEEVDWSRVKILNAWGAPGGEGRSGIYYEFCVDHGLEYFDFRNAKARWGGDGAFEAVCEKALANGTTFKPKFDVLLIDEAQDFAPNFLRLCYEYLKEPRRLVYAYDELQNLGNRSLPPAEEIFGVTQVGTPRVVIGAPEIGKPKQDIILDTCYRNSRPVLTTAHALGFGIYRSKGLVQIFENKNLWFDIGYELEDGGDIADGEIVQLARTPRSSPLFLEQHSPVEDLIRFEVFDDASAQTAWLVDSIKRNLSDDDLIPDDIVVINPDPFTTKDAVGDARRILFENGINSHLAGVTTIADVFSEPGTVTFTGIFRAKGNEAAMVYIINGQDCFDSTVGREVARIRNRLFTAITRSKAWVRVSGIGSSMSALREEFEKGKSSDFQLRFRYPTDLERKTMQTVNRDMSKAEVERTRKRRSNLADIVASLEAGDSVIDDYPNDLVEKLEAFMARKRRGRSRK